MQFSSKFPMGQMVCTKAVNEDLINGNDDLGLMVQKCLYMYGQCNWGVTCKEDGILNDEAVIAGTRIVAKYEIEHHEIFIVTEWDRSITTVMFCREY